MTTRRLTKSEAEQAARYTLETGRMPDWWMPGPWYRHYPALIRLQLTLLWARVAMAWYARKG